MTHNLLHNHILQINIKHLKKIYTTHDYGYYHITSGSMSLFHHNIFH
jgi:hypothetical protein